MQKREYNKRKKRIDKEGCRVGKTIYGKLFGHPQILVNQEPVFFSFVKINALLYYLLVNKTATREELSGLLWPEMKDQNAKKNLRNAIYQANKTLGVDLILSPNKTVLLLNEELAIQTDVDLFGKQPETHLALYQDEFLKGFYMKDCEDYDFWMMKMRNTYEKKFIETSFQQIEREIEQGHSKEVEKKIQRLIYMDEFNEENYQLLMRFYQKNEQDPRVIETYYQLTNLLKSELGVQPSRKTKEIYQQSLDRINQQDNMENQRFTSLFFGRNKERQKMESLFLNFYQDRSGVSLLIQGEPGVGKSALSQRVLDEAEGSFYVLETQCYQAEEKHGLRPWKRIVRSLSEILQEEKLVEPELWKEVLNKVFPNFEEYIRDTSLVEGTALVQMNVLSDVLAEAIKKIAEKKKLVIAFEDIQWMDLSSLSLLTDVLLQTEKKALFLLTARHSHKEAMNQVVDHLTRYHLLETIVLEPFDLEETKAFIECKLPDRPVSEKEVATLYRHTEGNAFFLIEYISLLKSNANLNIMTVKMKDALKNRFMYLSQEEQELVNVVSYFYDGVSLKTLAALIDKAEIEVVDTIEQLIQKNILREIDDGETIKMVFTHVKLKDYIYMNQSAAKQRLIHGKIADYLVATLLPYQKDLMIFAQIAYHYKHAHQELKSLSYKLKYLQSYLGYYHELYPIDVQNKPFVLVEDSYDQEYIFKEFDKIDRKLRELKDSYGTDPMFQNLEIQFLYLEGRYLIKSGEYEQGVENIQEVIYRSQEKGQSEFLLDGYKQMIYYYIQINQAEKMFDYIEKALNLAISLNNHQSIGILLRLKGVYYMMVGNHEMAEKLLNESINTFMITREVAEKHAVSIAAAYNYLGEIRLNEGRYEEALQMFQKAIEQCEDKKWLSSLSVFYANAGIASYAQKNYEDAENYFSQAQKLYDTLNIIWKKAQLDAYLALIALAKEDYDKVCQYIEKAKDYAPKLGNVRDIGKIYFAEALVKKQMKNQQLENLLAEKGILQQTSAFYYQAALEHLDKFQDEYERSVLQEVFTVEQKI